MLCAFILLILIQNKFNKDKMVIYIRAMVFWTTYAYIITEFLSFFNILTKICIQFGWILLDTFLLVICIKLKIKIKWTLQNFRKYFSVNYLQNYVLVLLGIISIFLAIKTVPYTWDSMSYHLARIAYWRQNQSVAHYATNVVRQVTSPVLAEFINLHIYINMNGNDLFMNVLQSVSYITNAVIVYKIAYKLGCRKKLCFLAAFLFMTMPIAFGESLTTQVDQFASMWTLSFVYILLDYLQIEKKIIWNYQTIIDVFCLSVMIALSYLAKPSVMFAIFLMALWLLIICFARKDSIIVLVKLFVFSLITIFVFLCPEVFRNLCTFHAISDPIAGARQLIGCKRPTYIFVNFLKNFVWNMPNIYWKKSTEYLTKFVNIIANIINVDINDASISEDGREFIMNLAQDYGSDTAINPIIVLVMSLCGIWIIFKIRKINLKQTAEIYSIVVISAFLIFCSLVRWESFVARYMLGYLALLCPMISIQIQDWGSSLRSKGLYYAFFGIIIFCSVTETINMISYHYEICEERGEENKEFGYFHWRNYGVYSAYVKMEKEIEKNGYKNIGIITSEVAYDYPMFKLLEKHVSVIKHINVKNATNKYEDPYYQPECIIVLDSREQEPINYHGIMYDKVLQIDEYISILSHE